MLPEYKTILYCTQLGPNALFIFRHAVALARHTGARIAALHVVETLSPKQEVLVERYAGEGTVHEMVEKEEKHSAARMRKGIAAFCQRELGQSDCAGLIGEILVAEGHAADQILHYVEKTGADLVVMGAHAESSIFAAMMGGTAQKVIRHCTVPVLVVQVPEEMQDKTLGQI